MSSRTVSVVLTADVMGYENAMGRAASATGKVGDEGDRANSRLRSGFQTAGKAAGTVFNTAVGVAGTLITKAGKAGYAFNSLQQDSRAALTAIMKSGEAANAQMDRLDQFTKSSPYSKTVFIDAQQNLLGFGVTAERVIPTLDAVQNAIAAQGKGAPEIQRAVASLAEMNSVGGMTGKTIRELGILGIDAATILGEKLGKTGAEIKKMASRPGGIPVEEIWDPLIEGLSEKFSGATDNIKEQATGAADRIKAAWRDIGGVMMEPFVSKTGGGQAVVWMNEFADGLRAVESKTGMVTDAILRRLDPAISSVSPLFQSATRAIQGVSFDQVNRGLDTLSKYSAPIGMVAGALAAMGTQWGPLRALGLSLNPVVTAVVGLVAASPQLRGVVIDTFKQFAPAADSAGRLVKVLADLANEVISAAAPGLAALGEVAARVVSAVLDLGLAFSPILGVLPPLVGVVASLAEALAKVPTPVLLGVAAVIALRGPLQGLAGLFTSAIGPLTQFAAATRDIAMQTGVSGVLVGMRSGAAGVASGFKAAGSAVMGAFGRPVMMGITAAIGLLTAGLTQQAQAAAEAERKADSYASTLDDVSGAVTAATEAMVLANLEESGTAESWAKAGVSAREMVDAVMNLSGTYEGWYSVQKKLKNHYGEHSAEVRGFSQAIIDEQNAIEGGLAAKQREIELSRDSADANKDAAEARRDAARAAEEAQRAEESLASARRAELDAAYAVQDAQARFNEALGEGAKLTRDAQGNIDLYSESSRAAIEPLSSWVDGINRGAEALVNQGATQSVINAYMEDSMAAFGGAAESAGAYDTEVQQLAMDLGLVPAYTSAVIDMTVEKEAAQQDIDSLLDEVKDAEGNVTIQADSTPAIDELLTTMGLVRDSEGNVTINADTSPQKAKLLLALANIDASTGTVKIDGNNKFANDKASQAVVSINSRTGTISIHGQDYATGLADTIVSQINGKIAYIRINGVNVANGYQGGLVQADGGVIRRGVQVFAHGGMRLPSQAMIQPPSGTAGLVQWAEDETAGEAFIPLAHSKRRRSQEILSQVADIFDMAVIPRPTPFADGGLSAPPWAFTPAPSASAVGVPDVSVQVFVEQPFTGKQLEAHVARVVTRFGKGGGL